MSRVIELKSETDYNTFLKSHLRGVIFYAAKWCEACIETEPLYARIANRYADRIALAHIDTDECGIEILNIPTFMACYNGKVVNTMEGVNSYVLKQFIRNAILYKPKSDVDED